jgi:hypothetical protein
MLSYEMYSAMLAEDETGYHVPESGVPEKDLAQFMKTPMNNPAWILTSGAEGMIAGLRTLERLFGIRSLPMTDATMLIGGLSGKGQSPNVVAIEFMARKGIVSIAQRGRVRYISLVDGWWTSNPQTKRIAR